MPIRLTTSSRMIARPMRRQRVAMLRRTYCSCRDVRSDASWSSSPVIDAKCSLEPEQVTRFDEEPVGRAAEVAESEAVILGERRAVAHEDHGPGDRPITEE